MTTSTGTVAQDTTGRRHAARILLQQPILTAAQDPETFELVRRHATSLKSMFADRLGYTLVVDTTFVRLTKAPIDGSAPSRPLRRSNGDEFGATAYMYLALVCAALLAPGTDDRVLVSNLVDRIRADAEEHGIELGDTLSERRHLVSALQTLQEWGVLGETDGEADRDADVPGEVLLTVDRALLPHLLSGPLHKAAGPAAVLSPPVPEPPTRRLYRRLVENPFVARTDLDAEALDVLVRDRAELTRLLDEDFGLVLEIRTEGALAYDPDGELTDVPFPGAGTLEQAALLLVSELTDRYDTEPGADLHVDTDALDAVLEELAATHARTWRRDYVRDVPLLRRDVVSLLARLGLARPLEDGLILAAPAARYRPTAAERSAT